MSRFTAVFFFPVTFLATASLCGQTFWMPWAHLLEARKPGPLIGVPEHVGQGIGKET